MQASTWRERIQDVTVDSQNVVSTEIYVTWNTHIVHLLSIASKGNKNFREKLLKPAAAPVEIRSFLYVLCHIPVPWTRLSYLTESQIAFYVSA